MAGSLEKVGSLISQKISLYSRSIVKKALSPSPSKIRQNIKLHFRIIEDPTQTHQVLMNHYTRGEHAMHETGGILEVTLDMVRIDERSASAHREFCADA